MSCQDFELDIGDYVDDALDEGARRRVEQHLAACAACRALADDLRTLRGAARSLVPAVPPAQVWTRIAAAIDAERPSHGRWRPLGMDAAAWRPALSAAAVLVLLVAGSWMAFHDAASSTARPRAAVARQARATSAQGETVGTALNADEQPYTDAIASLEQITSTEGSTLDQPTAAVVRENLAVVDKAIGESRQALQQDPASGVAQESLFEALHSKVLLLQETIALINEMRNGNQDGAARIISGMNQ